MKPIIVLSLLIVFSSINAEEIFKETSTSPKENKAFGVGEKLTFGIYYQFIRVGTATMEVRDSVEIDNYSTLHIQTKARSANFFDNFYKVRDEINSYIDSRRFFSRKFTKHLREGSYYVDVDVDYNYDQDTLSGKLIRYEDEQKRKVRKNGQKDFIVKLEAPVFDVLASFYYTRLFNLEPGIPLRMLSNDNEKLYPIIIYTQKKEVIKTDAGKFKTAMVIPKIKGEALFKQKGEIMIWLTDDDFKIPVRVESKLFFGSIYIELEKIEGHQLPLPSQVR